MKACFLKLRKLRRCKQTMVRVIIKNELQKEEDFKGACQQPAKRQQLWATSPSNLSSESLPISLLGRFFVVHEETGSFFEVDQEVFENVQQGECPDELTAVLPEQPTLEWLRNQLEQRPRQLSALCLNVTHTCNMACKYCFAQQATTVVSKLSWTLPLQRMLWTYSWKALLPGQILIFFGGEPLIAWTPLSKP